MRIASICPSNTEILHYLEATQYLVAVDDFSDWPSSIQHISKVGPDLNIDIDLLEEAKPDLVLASLSVPGMEKNIKKLEERKIPYIVLTPHRLMDIKHDILKIGEAIGMKNKAEYLAEAFDEQIKLFQETSNKITEKPTLYWEWWPKPVFTPGRKNWLTDISHLAGGNNIFHDINKESIQLSWDEVYRRNPDYICLVWVGVETKKMNRDMVRNRPSWEQLTAIQKNRILILEEWLFCRPSPRLLKGCLKLGKILHPHLYQSLSLLPPFQDED